MAVKSFIILVLGENGGEREKVSRHVFRHCLLWPNKVAQLIIPGKDLNPIL